MWWDILVATLFLYPVTGRRPECSQIEYDKCVRIADPLVKEAHLVFPDNLNDMDLVCRTWNRFVNCLRSYTDECFTAQQRAQFNEAVKSPIDSVHEMCMQPSYQKEYLRYAPCIKSTVTERIHCGPHYNILVEQVDQGDVISKSTLCCSYDRFKQCVQRETTRMCDQGIPDGPASRFATQTIDKALKFLRDQCYNFISNSADCVSPGDTVTSYSDRSDPKSVIYPVSSEVYPWSTIQHEEADDVRDFISSRLPKISTSSSWLPSSNFPVRTYGENTFPSVPQQSLGTRSRPASYGRSSSWSSSSEPTPSVNTVPMSSAIPSTSTPFTNKWGTVEILGSNVRSSTPSPPTTSRTTPSTTTARPSSSTIKFTTPFWYPTSTAETWYPLPGFQLNNEVDEPNQMGLTKPKNSAIFSMANMYFITFCLCAGRLVDTVAS
ncbi:uncharacterized protein LOC132706660 [Cylas formicarius]|uniref:uncharacterized protein LOC132706660 n=1 Tax=Cylas formicarius TaxID=197179 RepID=UPI0029583740|nr:uncharacterized protein LOC132706660 [Cylas formicarius]